MTVEKQVDSLLDVPFVKLYIRMCYGSWKMQIAFVFLCFSKDSVF